MYKKPPLKLETTTLWDYPSQHYGEGIQGDANYVGATPSYVIWNVLQRYTKAKDLVVDPMCGSGTTMDVARDLGRRALGYDVAPSRPDIFRADARKLPLEDEKADFVFVDPPYSTHIDYSEAPDCIGKLDAAEPAYYEAMEQVIREIHRVLRPNRHMALYVSDSFRKKKPFCPIGFRLFAILERYFDPVDIVAVTRHNRTMKRRHYHTEAVSGNYFLRGFNYLFIMHKGDAAKALPRRNPEQAPEPARTESPPGHTRRPAGPKRAPKGSRPATKDRRGKPPRRGKT